MKPWKLQHLTQATVRENRYQIAILPIGACEPHNFHLPYGSDAFQSELISDRVCEQATALGAKVIQLPTIPYGVQSNMFGLTDALPINIYPATLFAFLRDIVDSLERFGISKLVIFNSHGGNDFLKPFIREMQGRSKMFISVIDWWRVGRDVYGDIFSKPDDHAGEMETSVNLAIVPELVRMEDAADGAFKPTRFEAVNKGWVSISRPWHLLTESTGVGDPRAGTKEKGEKYLSVVVPRLAKFIAELSAADVNDAQFPF
ncbi:MAG: creatinine amidohydrolase [Phycisphaerales bacterium]|jgi:creatinine amidohydrolase|nr:creatinine amidohydrolase [Phycisphaerales bacterium]